MNGRREHLADYVEAHEQLAELQATFDLRWAADMRAIKAWQAVHPEKPLTWPDHADLVVWLAEQLSTLREAHEESERLLDRIEQRAALLPIGFDGGASRKTLRLQGVMFAHWISEQRAEMVLAARALLRPSEPVE